MGLYVKGINSLPVGDYKISVFEDTDGIKKIMVDLCHEENGLRVGDYKLLNFDEISTPHGRLIDADKLEYELCEFGRYKVDKDEIDSSEIIIETEE